MAAQRIIGTKLRMLKAGSEPDDTLVANLTSVGEIATEWEEMDVTDFDSPDQYREVIATLKDGGEVAISGFVKSNAHMEAMYDVNDSGDVRSWEMEAPNGDTIAFDAFLKRFGEAESAVDGARGYVGSLRVTGPVVYTPASLSV